MRKATMQEKREYAASRPLYPLAGYVSVGGVECAVEDLSAKWSKADPQYEVMAPDGFHFDSEMIHSMLCADVEEVNERAMGNRLAKCAEGGDCNCPVTLTEAERASLEG